MSDPDWSSHCGDGWRAHVRAMTGTDICDVVGPSPRRPADWAAMMRRLGVRTMSGVVSAVHGPAIPVKQARRGDVVRKGWALGVCEGELARFYGGVRVPIGEVDEAWRLAAAQDEDQDERKQDGAEASNAALERVRRRG